MSRTGTLALFLATLAASQGCRGKETDDARIRRIFVEAATAAEEKRIGDAVKDVSERFRSGDLDRDGVRQIVAGVVMRGGWRSAWVTGSTVRVDGDRAAAVVDVALARTAGKPSLAALAQAEASVYRVDVRLEREGEGWRVVAAGWKPVEIGEALAGPPEPGDPASRPGPASAIP